MGQGCQASNSTETQIWGIAPMIMAKWNIRGDGGRGGSGGRVGDLQGNEYTKKGWGGWERENVGTVGTRK